MPQFRPFRWVNYIMWTLLSLTLLVYYLDHIFIPKFTRLQIIRKYLSI